MTNNEVLKYYVFLQGIKNKQINLLHISTWFT